MLTYSYNVFITYIELHTRFPIQFDKDSRNEVLLNDYPEYLQKKKLKDTDKNFKQFCELTGCNTKKKYLNGCVFLQNKILHSEKKIMERHLK